MKNGILIGIIALGLTAPAFADDSDTLKNVIAHGTVVQANMQGQALELTMTYKADGTYTAAAGGQEIGGGTWKIDGDKLCTASQLGESCTAYPSGKAPGDSFKLTHATLGEITVKIKE
jgi:hypothetical protein